MALISWVARDFYSEDLWRGVRVESPKPHLSSWAGCLQPDCPWKKWVLSSGCLQGTAMRRPRHIVGKKEKYIPSLLSFPLSWQHLFKETVWRAPCKAQALPKKQNFSSITLANDLSPWTLWQKSCLAQRLALDCSNLLTISIWFHGLWLSVLLEQRSGFRLKPLKFYSRFKDMSSFFFLFTNRY